MNYLNQVQDWVNNNSTLIIISLLILILICSCNIKQQLSILSGGMNHKKHNGAGNCSDHEKKGGGMHHKKHDGAGSCSDPEKKGGGMHHKKHDGAGSCSDHEKKGGGMHHKKHDGAGSCIKPRKGGGEHKKPLVIKLFWVEWCGHCRKFKPVWEKLKRENTEDVNYEDVNCEEEKEIAHDEGIQGFPTIRLYDADNNLLEELEGSRDEDNIKNLIKNHM